MLKAFTRRSKPDTSSGDDGGTWGTVRFVLGLALLAWAVRSFLFAPFSIPSGSMLPTLYIGDYLMVAKWPYGYASVSFPFGIPSFDGRVLEGTPKRGDVVVFRHPTDPADLIKRVIAVPGDTIAVSGGRAILNGRALAQVPIAPARMPVSPNTPCKTVPPAAPQLAQAGDQIMCSYRAYRETLPGGPSYTVLDQVSGGPADDFGPVTVPAGHVFLMGDNRDDSLDSRFSSAEGGIALVPLDHLIGRAMVTFWSTDGSASYVLPWTWFTALRWDRIGNGYVDGRQ
ncbi:signal peptidase I [Sphingomonas lutea]|uniref:Signal peptidase I n=1 Tax=Sphingomonas lutea TaxID=1045317 RepID=A0A7G9SKN1_9SPHN|nr:signal peptidase I [Sphingomonas lutea]QNN68406.1 signal peptidase I [Sphingomonas lutea]